MLSVDRLRPNCLFHCIYNISPDDKWTADGLKSIVDAAQLKCASTDCDTGLKAVQSAQDKEGGCSSV